MSNQMWLPKLTGITASICFGINVLIIISLTFDRLAKTCFQGWARFMVFPCVWTAIWNILVYNSGDLINYAFAFLGSIEMLQFASLSGLGGLNFLLAWGGTVGAHLINKLSLTSHSHESLLPTKNNQEDSSSLIMNTGRRNRKTFNIMTNPVLAYIVALFLIIGYGSIRISLAYIPFYQKNIESFVPSNLTKVGCVIGGVTVEHENSYYIERTRDLASNGTQFILWSEKVAIANDTKQLDDLTSGIKEVSRVYNTYIGFTYIDSSSPDGRKYNKLTVISPTGDVLIDYAKSNLVPVIENDISPGTDILQTFDTPDFGIIGGAICYDYNFPKLIGQASTHDVDFMLDTSLTWGPIGNYHPRINVIRSIENGFTHFRCNSYGISGIWGPYGEQYAAIQTLEDISFTFQVPLYRRVKTVYGVFGEALAWACLGFTAAFFIIIILIMYGPESAKKIVIRLAMKLRM
ncbi:1082_t:CDS:2 [Acaulospora morrowiae]|uniref:1082_t:CDS:1 n=1 Tax=Acaulospora morrowiae TaxID=94023 RepID=A0A9N9G9T5_9GLOM|nr:1082_t:CDS:2 [Acaulospora morrowiae]